MIKKIALITGVTGQDGSYLSELLLEKGYFVHGVVRRSSSFNTSRIDHLINDPDYKERFFFHHGDITDGTNINNLLLKIKPDEIYNLAAQSHVKVSFDIPEYTANVDALGTLKILESIRQIGLRTKFYQASTSELYGKVLQTPQNENTPFYPRSPYAVSKLFSYWILVNYREAYGIHASNGILFNHESPRRGKTFVTRKITKGVANINAGIEEKICLGNLDSKRDWGYAPDYVKGMWMILQKDTPDDYVLATGKTTSVRDFTTMAFNCIDVDLEWIGSGINEKGVDKSNGKIRVEIDKKYFRPTEVDLLLGDPKKAKDKLGWSPSLTTEELVEVMVKSDINKVKRIAQ
tara:strand:- start:602 stop:1645 length:1044 start_codon:yes stop_codon:yes gene_type:complete